MLSMPRKHVTLGLVPPVDYAAYALQAPPATNVASGRAVADDEMRYKYPAEETITDLEAHQDRQAKSRADVQIASPCVRIAH
jgi:hypothetical protein